MKEKGKEPTRKEGDSEPASQTETVLLVLFLLLAFLLQMALLFTFWPERTADDTPWKEELSFLGLRLGSAGEEVRLLVLVIVAGALGSFIHVASSAGDYIGNRKLVRSWIFWYLLRLPVGAGLALIIYLLLRGGILTGMTFNPAPGELPYGIVGLAALAGMFAKKASNKLRDLFETLFLTQTDEKLKDKMDATPPVLDKIQPGSIVAGTESVELHLHGKNFLSSSRVRLGQEVREPEFKSHEELVLVLKAPDLAEPGTISIVVETPEIKDGRSEARDLEVTEKKDAAG